MHLLYLVSVWLHIVAAATWLGGMLFLVLVVVPWLRRNPGVDRGALLEQTGRRFRNVGWACFAVVLVSGVFNLATRGVRLTDFARVEWLLSGFGGAVVLKLAIFAVVLALSGLHDFWLGPLATSALKRDPRSVESRQLRKLASYAGRLNALLALGLVALGVVIVRGWP